MTDKIRRMNNKRFATTTGKRVKLLREDFDWSQEFLTDLIEKQYGVKIGQSYVSHMENNRTKPTGVVLAALARALRTTTDYLFLLTDDPQRLEDRFVALSEEAEQASTVIDGLPPQERAKCLDSFDAIEADFVLAKQEAAEVDALIQSVEVECGRKGRQLLERFFENRLGIISRTRQSGGNSAQILQ